MIMHWMKAKNIKYSCALFEVESQRVCLEKTRQVDTVMSKDWCCAILGVERLYYNINFNEQKLQVYCKSEDITNKELNPLSNYEEHK